MPTTCLNYDKKCGGCPLLALPYREQLNQKQARLQGLLGGFAPVRVVQGMAEPYHYRNKAIASFAMQHGRLVCGLYAEGTHRVLPSADCLLQEEILNKTLAAGWRPPVPAAGQPMTRTAAQGCCAIPCCAAAGTARCWSRW